MFDGACGICRTWVDYWRQLTGNRVAYRPYQEAATDFPAIPREAFEKATQLIFPDSTTLSGAAATYKLLSLVPGHGAWWWLYRHVPGAAGLSEAAYGFLSTYRGLLAGITHTLWGRRLEPARYALVSWLFLRGLGLIYLAAFASLLVQVRGLVGEAGILPAGEYLAAAYQGWGSSAYWHLPTLFWLDSSDGALMAGAWTGVALAVLLTIGVAQRAALIGLFALYLSFIYAGQIFLNYQWDMLLVETGFLAIFLTGGARLTVWLFRLLLFRFLFLAGVAKIISADPTWRDLTALDYHLFTQPLPSPLAYYAAQLPHWLLAFATAATLVIELFAVAMIFMPRRPRMVAAGLVVILQTAIMLTGSYTFCPSSPVRPTAHRDGTFPISRASIGSCGLPPTAMRADRDGSRVCCSAFSRAARTCSLSSRSIRSLSNRLSACVSISQRNVFPMQRHRGGHGGKSMRKASISPPFRSMICSVLHLLRMQCKTRRPNN